AVLQPGFTGTTAPDWLLRRVGEGLSSVGLFGRNIQTPEHQTPPPRIPWHHFTKRFSTTPRGARLARRQAGERLDVWGVPYRLDHPLGEEGVGELEDEAVGLLPGERQRLGAVRAH
ncbi:hypothetical protein, partial [Streptomyces sp. BE230]|uniref:hypothetical protein n=1 Tax=Streptomyces sp. BE230 TaxID=3002526 RepID=UPI002ED5675D|nr:hypothetical protein [Streptomyces sp. BE230]